LYISPDQRDELVRQLQLVELPVRYVVQESAAQTLEISATFVGSAIIGARVLPPAAWTALGDVLTALVNKNRGRRVEISFGNGRKVVVENDRRAVRTLIDQIVPVVRQQMIDVQQQWDQAHKDLASTAAEATTDDAPNDDGEAGAATG
jgi:antitoxin component of MazEF toxin-antitoxin module